MGWMSAGPECTETALVGIQRVGDGRARKRIEERCQAASRGGPGVQFATHAQQRRQGEQPRNQHFRTYRVHFANLPETTVVIGNESVEVDSAMTQW